MSLIRGAGTRCAAPIKALGYCPDTAGPDRRVVRGTRPGPETLRSAPQPTGGRARSPGTIFHRLGAVVTALIRGGRASALISDHVISPAVSQHTAPVLKDCY